MAYREPAQTGAALHAKGILVRSDAKVPRICIGCGAKKRLTKHDRIGSDDVHPFVYGNPVAALAGNLFVLLLRVGRPRPKAAALVHWRCAACDARMREAGTISPVILIGPFAVILLGVMVGFATEPVWGWVAALGGAVAVLLIARAVGSGGVTVADVTANGVVLSGVSAPVADALLKAPVEPSPEEAAS